MTTEAAVRRYETDVVEVEEFEVDLLRESPEPRGIPACSP